MKAGKLRRYRIAKESYKFSSAHMTVFPDGRKEALHGHNYQVLVEMDLFEASLKDLVDFKDLKSPVKSLCEEWDEAFLLAENCPFLKITSSSTSELEFVLCGKRYVLPADEVRRLPVENISSESLAELFALRLEQKLDAILSKRLLRLEVAIQETEGQMASFEIQRAP